MSEHYSFYVFCMLVESSALIVPVDASMLREVVLPACVHDMCQDAVRSRWSYKPVV